MSAVLPRAVERYLTPQRLARTVAHVLVDRSGKVASLGGALSHFGLDHTNVSWIVEMFTPWFDSTAVAEDRTPVAFVQLGVETYADIHFVDDGELTWIVLVDSTSEAVVAQSKLQQRLMPFCLDLRTDTTQGLTAHASVLCGLAIGTFERLSDNVFLTRGQLPDWMEFATDSLLRQGRIQPKEHPVLQYFMPDAEQAWDDLLGRPVQSLIWSETLTNGEVAHLQAVALTLPESDVLLLRRLFDHEIENSGNVQRANDQALLAADAERRLYNEGERLRVTLESIAEAVLTTNHEGCVEYMNLTAERLTGWHLAAAAGRPSDEIVRLVDDSTSAPIESPVAKALTTGKLARSETEASLIGRNGNRCAVDDSAAPIFDANGDLVGAVVVLQNVTTTRAMVREARHQAEHDPLTGLANRREFGHRVDSAIANAQATGQRHAICYLDLDDFKSVNDSQGHQAGDAVLQQVAERLQATVRSGDTLARIGGDEFCVLLNCCDIDAAEHVARDLAEAVARTPFSWGTHEYQLGVSIGVSEVNSASTSLADALARADDACYVAKRESGSAVFRFDEMVGGNRPNDRGESHE